MSSTPTHFDHDTCSWKNTTAAIMPMTKLMLIIGYATLKGKVFTMYIHKMEARPKQSPQAANCQLTRTLARNVRFRPNGAIRMSANFSSTCPPVSRTHCKIVRGMTLNIYYFFNDNELHELY